MNNENFTIISKPSINQKVPIDIGFVELIKQWNIKFELEIKHDGKIYFTTLDTPGNIEKRTAEVYEIKDQSVIRHPNRIVFTWESRIIGIGEEIVDQIRNNDNKQTFNQQNNPVKASRLGLLKDNNKDEFKAKLFPSNFLTNKIQIEVMIDNLLNKINNHKNKIKFQYFVVEKISKLKNLELDDSPKFIFYKTVNENWNVILLRKNLESKNLEGLCKEIPDLETANQFKKLTGLETFSKQTFRSDTTDPGLEAVKAMVQIGCTLYSDIFEPLNSLSRKRSDLIRYPLLIDFSLKRLNEDIAFQNAFDKSMYKIPEANEHSKKFRKLLLKLEKCENNDSEIDENFIEELENAKRNMLNSYKTEIDHFKTQYQYNENSSNQQNQTRIGMLTIEIEYERQMQQLNVLIDLFKQFYEEDKFNRSKSLIDEEVERLIKIFKNPKLQQQLRKYLNEKMNENSKNESIQPKDLSTFSTNEFKSTRLKESFERSCKKISEIVSEVNFKEDEKDDLAENFFKVELLTKSEIIETSYQNKFKDWSASEIKNWCKTLKGHLLNTDHAILTAIALMDRANELVTNGHRLRDTQKIAILIFIGVNYRLAFNVQDNTETTDDLVFFLNEKNKLAYSFNGSKGCELENDVDNYLFLKIKNELLNNSKAVTVKKSEAVKGHISQIKTGEGKTTIVAFVSALKVLQGHKVDVITSNSVLAADGVKDKENFYSLLNISASHNNPDSDSEQVQGSRKCYTADIVYGSISNFQFDFLRDRFECMETFGTRKPENNWVVLDEVDSLLIDQGGNIAKLSSPLPGMECLRYVYINIWKALDHYEKETDKEIQLKLDNKKIQLEEKFITKISKLNEKYKDKISTIQIDESLNEILIKQKSDLNKNQKAIQQLECQIFQKKLEKYKNYKFTLNLNSLNKNDIKLYLKDSKLMISTNLEKNGAEIKVNENNVSQEFYNYIKDKIEKNSKEIDLPNSYELVLLKAFSTICPFARINVTEDLIELDDLDEENQLEYEQEEDRLAEIYIELVTSKIKNQKEVVTDLIRRRLIPKHLYNYVNKNLDRWVQSALSAKYYYQENQQYKLIPDKDKEEVIIIPVDNLNTGVSMHNTILSNGLHQFLQIKHNIALTFESLTSSYISNIGYIKKYGSKILGLTGTLGSAAEQELLGEVYNLGFSAIPTYKHKNFYEFPGQVVKDSLFIQNISILALGELLRTDEDDFEKPRSVLIICDSIKDAFEIENEIKKQSKASKVSAKLKIYTDEAEAEITESILNPNEIVIATNIAGRGTDFKTSEELEANGGLHVIVGFLPCNQRVQDQALGRTSRQGNNGSGQLIVRASEIANIGSYDNIEFGQVIKRRDELEKARIAKIRSKKLKELYFKDNLFEYFSKLYRNLKIEHKYDDDPKWKYLLKDLKEKWAFWLEEQDYTSEKIISLNEKNEFNKFLSDDIVLKITKDVHGISLAHNSYYAICLAEEYLDLGGKENFSKAKEALFKAIEIGGHLEPLYSAYVKLFEISMIEGGQILKRYQKAVAKIFFIPVEIDENYKSKSLDYLIKAKEALEVEHSYLDDLFKEGNLDSIIISSSSCSLPTQETELSNNINYNGNINSIIKHMEDNNHKDLSFDVGVKAPRYLSKLDSSDSEQQKLKQVIGEKDVNELDSIGMGCIYGLKEIHDVPPTVIKTAQAQIGSGLALLIASWIFPPALAGTGSIAGTLISEGITDIITELVKQGEEKFNKKDYVKGKIISYGISIITMGIGAIMSSTKILNKAMNACRNLATKLRACSKFKSVCNFVANNLDKLANYLKLTIEKIEFTRMALAAQQKYLVGLQKDGLLKQFQNLQKLLKSSDMVLSHSAIIKNIALNSVFSSFQSVGLSVCMEKIITANLGKVMSGLEPKINEWVKKTITEREEIKENLLDTLTDEELDNHLKSLFKTSINEDFKNILKETSLGVLRHSTNWKMQLISLGIDTSVVFLEIMTCTNKICDKLFKNLELNKCNIKAFNRDYSQTIDSISNQVSKIIFSKVVSTSSKIATTLPKIIYRGYKQHQENIKDKKAISKHSDRLKAIKEANDEAKNNNRLCGQEAIASIFGIDPEELACATSVGASKDGLTIEDMKNLIKKNGIDCFDTNAADAINEMHSSKSDRAIACLKDVDGVPHAVPVFLDENMKLMTTDENNNKISLEKYQIENGYKKELTKIIIPIDLNADTLKKVNFELNKRRIASYTHSLSYIDHSEAEIEELYGATRNIQVKKKDKASDHIQNNKPHLTVKKRIEKHVAQRISTTFYIASLIEELKKENIGDLTVIKKAYYQLIQGIRQNGGLPTNCVDDLDNSVLNANLSKCNEIDAAHTAGFHIKELESLMSSSTNPKIQENLIKLKDALSDTNFLPKSFNIGIDKCFDEIQADTISDLLKSNDKKACFDQFFKKLQTNLHKRLIDKKDKKEVFTIVNKVVIGFQDSFEQNNSFIDKLIKKREDQINKKRDMFRN